MVMRCDMKATYNHIACEDQVVEVECADGQYVKFADYEQLQQRNDELASQVERLRGGLNQAIELLVTALHEPQQVTESEIHDLRTLEKETPDQCLAEIKAQAVEDALSAIEHYVLVPDTTQFCIDVLRKYANTIRNQKGANNE